jgi:hypothetical protein
MLTDYFSCAPTKFLNGHVAFEVALEQVNQQPPLEVMSAAHMTQEKESEGCGEQCPRNDEGYRIVFHGGRFLIRTLAEVSKKRNTVPAWRPIKFGRLECGQGRLAGTMSHRYRIACRPMFLSE